jgi:hypothetical protein
LTEPQVGANANGDRVLTQWFERARFEYHPRNPRPSQVLLDLMGIERAFNGTFTPPAPCQATPNATQRVVVGGQPSFCIAWRDTFTTEQNFFVILKYLNSGEEFRYLTPADTMQLYVPANHAPSTTSFEQCVRRKNFRIEVYATGPNMYERVGDIAGAVECRR